MGLYLQLGDIKGEATEQNHKDWIDCNTMSNAITRSVSGDARGAQRARGTTGLGDVVVVRKLDKSSVKIAEACAAGRYFDKAELHLTSVLNNKEETVLKIVLSNVLTTSYSLHAQGDQKALPTEEITINYTKIEWTYAAQDNKGKGKGNVVASFDLEKSAGA